MRMRTLIPVVAILALSMAVAPVIAGVAKDGGVTGNGAMSGPHYTLNLLGKDWEHPEDSVLDDGGHRIFVRLGAEGTMARTTIRLIEDTTSPYEFAVLDADGTDGKASLMLPAPGSVIDTSSDLYNPDAAAYKIFIRVLGKPSGQAEMYSVYYDADTMTSWVSGEVIEIRQSGGDVNRKSPPKFVDVTKELTTIYVDMNGDGIMERYQLFDPMFEDFFWYYDNQGIRHVQLRFYPTELFPV